MYIKTSHLPPLLLLLLLAGHHAPTDAAKVLLYPFNAGYIACSRLFRMQQMASILVQDGHSASMIVHSKYDKYSRRNITGLELVRYPAPDLHDGFDDEIIQTAIETDVVKSLKLLRIQQRSYCEGLVGDQKILAGLKRSNFDVLIVDYIDACGRIIVDYMDIPTIVFANYGFEVDFGLFAPLPLAYVPHPYTANSHEMNFLQRSWNVVAYLLGYFVLGPIIFSPLNELKQQYGLNTSLSIYDSHYRADIVLVNTDFAIDFPRPVMPNIVPIAGLLYEPSKPLPKDLADFVAGSGQHGFVVVSFGSQLKEIDETKAAIFARVLARLPQKVLWRHDGKVPSGLGANTQLLKWLPQNDLLGHPKARLFISHCGASAMHEAVQHGVPVVAIPIFSDQIHQAVKLVSRAKTAVWVDYPSLTEQALADAIREVIENPTYTARAKKVSRLVHEQPVSAKTKFLFWVNFLADNGRADHLQPEVARSLSWTQYLLLDVTVFLVAVITCVLYIIFSILRMCCRIICCRGGKTKQE